jgi:peptidoglycan/xylan/chitin deacetylase (PgdA/CDA1 family)
VTERLRTFALHAERLHLDSVWRRTSAVLDRLERRGGRATMFVHPFEAIESGVSLGPRVAQLLDRGHEVAQHTHFYEARSGDARGKLRTDLDPANIRRNLDRDLAYLRSLGADPRGFTSGGWVIEPEVEAWLADHGFAYDCSFRSFDLRYPSAAAAPGGGYGRPELAGPLLRLPTTASLRGAVWSLAGRRTPSLDVGDLTYSLAYSHDYDLLVRVRALASALVVEGWSRGPGRWITAAELAERIREHDRG